MARYEVAVVGGGHNGLVAGVELARAGLSVVVLEANEEPGGCIWTEHLESGHRLERGAIDHSQIVDVAQELGLADHGLEYRRRSVAVGAAFGNGQTRMFPVAEPELRSALASTGDVDAYMRLSDLGSTLFDLIDSFETPPALTALAAALHALPEGDRLMRIIIASADSVLGEYLADPHLISAVAMYGAHSQVPSFMPGTGMFALLLPASLGEAPARPIGGSLSLIRALVSALEAAGGALRLGSRVTRISQRGTEQVLSLADGDEIAVGRVVSTLDVRRLAGLLDSPPAAIHDAARRSHDGSLNVGEIKIDLALSERPDLGPLEEAPQALWMVQEHVDSLRSAYGDVMAGRIPTSPAFMWASPSETDPTAAPESGAVVWISAFMPLKPQQGEWTPQLEQEAAERILDGYASITGRDLRPHASSVQVTGPRTWASRIGSATGNPNHLDLTLDQMLGWRPVGMAGHRSPLPWLYLSGAGTHPGGGLSGLPGRNAARALIADIEGRKKRSRGNGNRVQAVKAAWDIYRSLRK